MVKVDYGRREFLRSCVKLGSGLFAPALILPRKSLAQFGFRDLPYMAKSSSASNGLLTNLVHYFQLTESAAPFADSGSNPSSLSYTNSGTDFSSVTGHVQSKAAHYGGLNGCNGISSIVAVGYDYSGDGNATILSMSYMCWFNITASIGTGPIFGQWSNSQATTTFLFYRNNASGGYNFNVFNQSGVQVSTAGQSASDAAWHLFIGGFDHANSVLWQCIDNGSIQTAACASENSVNAAPFVIMNWAASCAERTGSISDVGVWNNRSLYADAAARSAIWNGGAGLPFSQFAH